MHQAQVATMMYLGDYEDFFMPVNHRPGAPPNSRLDRTWVQLILPYVSPSRGTFSIFTCPSDTSTKDNPETTFDQDLIPGDIYSQYYTASMHTTMGFNYIYLSPIMLMGGQWTSRPRSTSEVGDNSKTLLFVDSIWNRTRDGRPVGGGNWLVVPPCRYTFQNGERVDTFRAEGSIYAAAFGWKVTDPNSPNRYGNAWPWHAGRINIVRVDGSAKSVTPNLLTTGCEAEDNWKGAIRNPNQYIWDNK